MTSLDGISITSNFGKLRPQKGNFRLVLQNPSRVARPNILALDRMILNAGVADGM